MTIPENRPRSAGRKLKVKHIGPGPQGSSHYMIGECNILQTNKNHFSISHAERNPTWEEITAARYALLPKLKDCAMVLPPDDHYANLHEHCFHIFVLRSLGPNGIFHNSEGW